MEKYGYVPLGYLVSEPVPDWLLLGLGRAGTPQTRQHIRPVDLAAFQADLKAAEES